MVDQSLIRAFKYQRMQVARGAKGIAPAYRSIGFAIMSFTLARADVAAKTERYPTSRCIEYNQAADDGLRWIENATDGLRFVGLCDEIARSEGRSRAIDNLGWFANEFQDSVLRGVVFQLPARKGKAQYVVGYASSDECRIKRGDAWNVKNARLNLSSVYDDKMDAALASDRIAQLAAESECEYQQAWSAGNRYSELGEEISATRKETLALLIERRAARDLPAERFASICSLIRSRVAETGRAIQRARTERAELLSTYSSGRAWRSWNRLQDAFREGAELPI